MNSLQQVSVTSEDGRATVAPLRIRGRSFPTVVLQMTDGAGPEFYEALDFKLAQAPRFFHDVPFVLDLNQAPGISRPSELVAMTRELRARNLTLIGIQNGTDEQNRAALAAGHRRPEGVASVMPPVYSTDGHSARIDVVLADNPYSNHALDVVEGPIREAAHASGAGERILVGGQTAASADIRTATNQDFALVFPVAALAIGLLLAWLLRSLIAPLYLLGAVMLGFAATLGFTVGAFQGIFGEPGLKSTLPIILYLFVVAVGTDYSILMTARLREEALEGRPPRQATTLGVEHGGPAVAAAGIILAGTFTSLLLTGIASLMQIGFAVSSGILIAALVMATLLVPSITTLLGHRAWWPGNRGERGARPGQDPAT